MKKNKKNNITNPDPYEDIVRLENLDPYESVIKLNMLLKQNKKSFE